MSETRIELKRPFPPKEVARFEAKIVKLDSCWEWRGGYFNTGYGVFSTSKKRPEGRHSITAHRYAYELYVGPCPMGLQLDHLCRNKRCVNPDHLEPVTSQENSRRAKALITECPAGHPYTPDNIYWHTRNGRKHRECKTCVKARTHAHYWNNVRTAS